MNVQKCALPPPPTSPPPNPLSPNAHMHVRTHSSAAGQRGAKTFKFNEAGKFIRMGQTVRAKAQLEKLQSEIAATAKKTGISAATKLALITPSVDTGEDIIPEVEWWDIPILANGRCVVVQRLVQFMQLLCNMLHCCATCTVQL